MRIVFSSTPNVSADVEELSNAGTRFFSSYKAYDNITVIATKRPPVGVYVFDKIRFYLLIVPETHMLGCKVDLWVYMVIF